MNQIYDFKTQLAIGAGHALTLDRYFSRFYRIKKVPMTLERLGVDRIWENKLFGTRYTVEYKADERAKQTGNVFIEIVSNDVDNIRGWVYTSVAQILIYFVPPDDAYVIQMLVLRGQVDSWLERYKRVKAKNQTYNSEGLLVPLDEFARLSRSVTWAL